MRHAAFLQAGIAGKARDTHILCPYASAPITPAFI
jgi:ribosome modulation factor